VLPRSSRKERRESSPPSRGLLLFGGGQGGPPPPGFPSVFLPFLGHAPARWPGAEKSAPLPPLARGVPPVRTQAFMCGYDGPGCARRDPPEPQELSGCFSRQPGYAASHPDARTETGEEGKASSTPVSGPRGRGDGRKKGELGVPTNHKEGRGNTSAFGAVVGAEAGVGVAVPGLGLGVCVPLRGPQTRPFRHFLQKK